MSCAQFFEAYNKLLTTGLPNGYRGYMSRSTQGVGMDLTLVSICDATEARTTLRCQCIMVPSVFADQWSARCRVLSLYSPAAKLCLD